MVVLRSISIDSGVYLYEVTDAGNDRLGLGFLFASGTSVVVEFESLVFRQRRIRRSYSIGDIYQ